MNLMRYLKSVKSALSPEDVYIHIDTLFFSFGIYVGHTGLEIRSDMTEIIGVDMI